MTAYDFEGNDWDEITESEKRNIVDRLVRGRDAISEDYEALAAEHDLCAIHWPPLREALRAWLDSHGEADIEERLAEAANEWFAATPTPTTEEPGR